MQAISVSQLEVTLRHARGSVAQVVSKQQQSWEPNPGLVSPRPLVLQALAL